MGMDPSTDGKEIELTGGEKKEIQDLRFKIPLSNEAINVLYERGGEDLELYREALRNRLKDRRETGAGLFRFKPAEIEKRLRAMGYEIYEARGKFHLKGAIRKQGG